MKAKYLNPFTDFGFKKLFGEEVSKPLLIDFLNALLYPKEHILDLTFKNIEQLGFSDSNRKAVYDIYCENDKGEKFIVELQKAKQNYFKDRTIFYSTFPIQEQAEKGEWNFQLKAVYCIGILDFVFNDYATEQEKQEVLHTIQLKNQHGKVFYDKLTYLYLEMPNFNLQETQLLTRLDKWLYIIRHLEDFQTIPLIFKDVDKVFTHAFETVALAQLNDQERARYEHSLKVFRDNKNTFDYAVETAFGEGKIEGKIEGEQIGIEKGKNQQNIETVKQARLMGLSIQDIVKLTGLTKEEIKKF